MSGCRHRFAIGFIVAILLPLNGFVRAGVRLELVGQWGGSIYGVTMDGDRVYVGVGPRVVILDASNPAAPRLLGRSPVLPHIVGQISVANEIVYVADGYGDFQVLDVSNPASPTATLTTCLGGECP